MSLHGQMRVPDSAAQQGHIGDHGLDEAIVRSPQHLAVRRLLDAPARILLGIDQRRALDALHQQQRLSQQHVGSDLLRICSHIGFQKCDEPVHKRLHPVDPRHSLRGNAQPEGTDPLQDSVAAKAIDHPDPGPAAADHQVPVHQIAAAAYAQHFIEPAHVFVKIGR